MAGRLSPGRFCGRGRSVAFGAGRRGSPGGSIYLLEMGLIYDLVTRSAADRVGESGERMLPPSQRDAVFAFLLLAGWLLAAGLLLSGIVWLVSGAGATAAIPLAIGLALTFALARFGSRLARRRR